MKRMLKKKLRMFKLRRMFLCVCVWNRKKISETLKEYGTKEKGRNFASKTV